MTRQEIFNEVWGRFILDRAPASFTPNPDLNSDSTALCAYRGPGGARCAVGLFIPDEIYDPRLENVNPAGLLFHLDSYTQSDPFLVMLLEHHHFLEELQVCHDDSCVASLQGDSFHVVIEQKLRELAWDEDLEVPETDPRSVPIRELPAEDEPIPSLSAASNRPLQEVLR